MRKLFKSTDPSWVVGKSRVKGSNSTQFDAKQQAEMTLSGVDAQTWWTVIMSCSLCRDAVVPSNRSILSLSSSRYRIVFVDDASSPMTDDADGPSGILWSSMDLLRGDVSHWHATERVESVMSLWRHCDVVVVVVVSAVSRCQSQQLAHNQQIAHWLTTLTSEWRIGVLWKVDVHYTCIAHATTTSCHVTPAVSTKQFPRREETFTSCAAVSDACLEQSNNEAVMPFIVLSNSWQVAPRTHNITPKVL